MANWLTITTSTWVALPLRLALGTIMFAHGAQKLLGVWDGPGFERWINQPAPVTEMRPAWAWMAAAAFAEFFGGAMVLLGAYTRLGAFLIACVMLVAIFGYHWRAGFFITSGGFEYALALLAMAIALMIVGGGRASLDERA
jgi:putative oxidoreductase